MRKVAHPCFQINREPVWHIDHLESLFNLLVKLHFPQVFTLASLEVKYKMIPPPPEWLIWWITARFSGCQDSYGNELIINLNFGSALIIVEWSDQRSVSAINHLLCRVVNEWRGRSGPRSAALPSRRPKRPRCCWCLWWECVSCHSECGTVWYWHRLQTQQRLSLSGRGTSR